MAPPASDPYLRRMAVNLRIRLMRRPRFLRASIPIAKGVSVSIAPGAMPSLGTCFGALFLCAVVAGVVYLTTL
jgi:hypothetical protein